MAIWFVVSSMAGPEAANKGAVDLYSCMCLLGYGMLPMVLYAVVSLLIPRYVRVDGGQRAHVLGSVHVGVTLLHIA